MQENFIYGIDVSHHNGTINWIKVKAASPEISFVYIKATEGTGFKDPACLLHANASLKAGIPFGYYHFSTLNNHLDPAKDAAEEAKYFDAVLKSMPLASLLPVLDIETNEKNLTTQQVQQWITSFISTMRTLGHEEIMFYSNKPFCDENLPVNHPFGNLPLWLAQYRNVASPVLPKGWNEYTVWQYTDKGKVSGINGACDMNKASASFLSKLKISHNNKIT